MRTVDLALVRRCAELELEADALLSVLAHHLPDVARRLVYEGPRAIYTGPNATRRAAAESLCRRARKLFGHLV